MDELTNQMDSLKINKFNDYNEIKIVLCEDINNIPLLIDIHEELPYWKEKPVLHDAISMFFYSEQIKNAINILTSHFSDERDLIINVIGEKFNNEYSISDIGLEAQFASEWLDFYLDLLYKEYENSKKMNL